MSKAISKGDLAPLSVVATASLALLLAVGIDASVTRTLAPAAAAASVVAAEISCGDFLAQLNKKPPALEFVSCGKTVRHGTSALEATYRVAGGNAAAVETHLIKSGRMPRLRFICCGWESLPASPQSQARTGVYVHRGQRFEITMTSGESLVNQRRRWAEIPYFQVKVTTYTESP